MNHTYYPSKTKTPKGNLEAARKALQEKWNQPKPCPVCIHGMRKDSKTGKLRDCVACGATGKLKL